MSSATATVRRRKLGEVAKAHAVQIAYLFGSQADQGLAYLAGEDPPPRDDPLTDLDVGVVLVDPDRLRPAEKVDLYADLSNDLQDLFAPFSVDLVLLDETHSVFQAEAICGHCIYAVSEGVREAYEMRILARAADFKPVLDLYYRERFEEL